uniref:Uncharacterized protein n=1 Tax=Anguilla anguilla TaxID=7936 RepID=A0A0E9W1B9_ANGAN
MNFMTMITLLFLERAITYTEETIFLLKFKSHF